VAKAPEPPAPPPETASEPEGPPPEKVLQDVLARLQKDDEKRKKTESGPSAGASGWEQRQSEIQYHQYYDQVERRVRENWIPPTSMESDRRDVMTVVSITLLPDGRVLESFVEESSGDPLFDQSVMRALLKSTPLPPPPIGLRQNRYELGLRFHSQPRSR
jgi:colicin import membrane protein